MSNRCICTCCDGLFQGAEEDARILVIPPGRPQPLCTACVWMAGGERAVFEALGLDVIVHRDDVTAAREKAQ